MWKHDVFAILLIIVTLYFAQQYLVKEGFSMPWDSSNDGACRFLTAEETRVFIARDPDMYVSSFSTWDLIARKCEIELDYLKRAAAAATDFNAAQKSRLVKAAIKADEFFGKLRATPDKSGFAGLDAAAYDKIFAIPWVFALTNCRAYEDGHPHTRANVIFLSTLVDETPERLIKTLVHEKLHLFQRLYPQDMMQIMHANGFVRWKQRFGVPRIRANPDLDPYIYIDPKSESPMLAVYSSDKPNSIQDIDIKYGTQEHPYEQMAYIIAANV